MLLELVRANVAVYSPHTAFDNTIGGINEILANRIGLTNLVPLRSQNAAGEMKIVVFVPDPDLARVSNALFEAGAGQIGQYRECSFRLAGTGTFFGSDATNPTVGQMGQREEVAEWRLEVLCPQPRLDPVLTALRQSHSLRGTGVRRVPAASAPLGRRRGPPWFARRSLPARRSRPAALKTALKVPALASGRPLDADGGSRVAIVCGAGGELLSDVLRSRADVFLTGELRFHDYLRGAGAARPGSLLLPGHYASEPHRCRSVGRTSESTMAGRANVGQHGGAREPGLLGCRP